MGRSLPLFLYFCLWPKAKDLGITRVVVGFFIWSMPYQLPPPCYPQFFKYFKSIYLSIYLAVFFLSIYPFPKYQYIIAADLGAGISPCCLFNTKDMKHCSIKISPMTGFKPLTSGVGSDCYTNWATTTAHINDYL